MWKTSQRFASDALLTSPNEIGRADALNRILDEAMRKGVVSEEYDVRDDWEP